MKYFLIPFLFIFLAGKYTFSYPKKNPDSNSKIDSLNLVIQQGKISDEEKVKNLFLIADEYLKFNLDTALLLYLKILKESQRLKMETTLADAYNQLGTVERTKSNFIKAIEYNKNALIIFERLIKDTDSTKVKIAYGGKAKTLSNLGVIYRNQGKNPLAFNCYMEALNLSRKLGDKNTSSAVLGNIGIIYWNQKKFQEALDHFFSALELAKETEDNRKIAIWTGNIANVYNNMKDYPKAIKYYEEVLSMAKGSGDKELQQLSLGNMGVGYGEQFLLTLTQGDTTKAMKEFFGKAMEKFTNAMHLAIEIGNRQNEAWWCGEIASLYKLTGDYIKEEEWLTRASLIMNNISSFELQKNHHQDFSNLFSITADRAFKSRKFKESALRYQKAYTHFQKFSDAMDSLSNQEKSKSIGRLEMKHETEMEELRMEKIQEEEKRVRLERTTRRNHLQYTGVVVIVVFLFISLLGLKKLHVSVKFVKGLMFLSFLIGFEFLLVLCDPVINYFSGDEPIWKFLFNALLAGIVLPIHHFGEKFLMQRLFSEKSKSPIHIQSGKTGNHSIDKINLIMILGFSVEMFIHSGFVFKPQVDSSSQSLRAIGKISKEQGNYPKAYRYFLKALGEDEERGDKNDVAKDLMLLAQAYKEHSEYEKSLEYFGKVLKFHEERNDSSGMARVFDELAGLYYFKGDIDKSLEYSLMALKILEKSGTQSELAIAIGNTANIYEEMKDYSKAMEFYKRALALKEKLNDKKEISITLGNMGTLLSNLGRFEEAGVLLRRGLSIDTTIGFYLHLGFVYQQLARLNYKTANAKLNKNDYSSAAMDFKVALDQVKLFRKVNDSIFNEEKSREIGRLEMKHEIDKAKIEKIKQAEITARKHKEERSRKNFLQYSGILMLIIFLGSVILIFTKMKIPAGFAVGMVFFVALLLFQFFSLLLEPFIDSITGGAPLYKLGFNVLFVVMLTPVQQFLEGRVRRKIVKEG